MGLGLALESEGRPNTALEAYRKAVSTGYLNPNLQAYVETKIDRLLGG